MLCSWKYIPVKYADLTYLSHQQKYTPAKCSKNKLARTNSCQVKISFIHSFIHSFTHSFIPNCFLDRTNLSKDVICLNVKDVESIEVETKNVRNMQSYYFILLQSIKSVKIG